MLNGRFGRALTKCLPLAILIGAAACSTGSDASDEIRAGLTREEVTAIAGDPDDVVEFVFPDEPFFGPQEGLVNLLQPGTPVEEWTYKSGDDITYVWFAGRPDQPREDWRVIDTAVYPVDAVY